MNYLAIALVVLLFAMILIPLLTAAPTTIQELDVSLDERMHLLQGRSYRNAFISTLVFALLIIQYVEDGFTFRLTFPLRFAEGMIIGVSFFALLQIVAHIIRIRVVKKEEAEDIAA